jgi:hypothetical protein
MNYERIECLPAASFSAAAHVHSTMSNGVAAIIDNSPVMHKHHDGEPSAVNQHDQQPGEPFRTRCESCAQRCNFSCMRFVKVLGHFLLEQRC